MAPNDKGEDAAVAQSSAITFGEALSRSPLRAFQWATLAVCLLVLVCDGIDMQLLGVVATAVIKDFHVTRGTFGIAMSAARSCRPASRADGVWAMAGWRVLGGIGFGAAYSNALAMATEWLPERWRPVAVSTLSVGTPLGGTVAGWIGPVLVLASGWRGTFVSFGLATLLLVVVVLAILRDSPSFLLAKGKTQAAAGAARRVLGEGVELVADSFGEQTSGGARIGVLHPSNLRLNIGIGIAFAAAALVAYGILNWTTTMLTARGFTLGQAGNVVSVAGITSMVGSVAAGMLTRQFGSRRVLTTVGVSLVVLLLALAFVVQTLAAHPGEQQRLVVLVMIGVAAAVFSAGIATLYVVMALGYPQSCRSAGIGFGIFMSRVGAISASGLGGALLDLGHGSVLPFFGVLALSAVLVSAAALIIDRHVPPARATG